MRKRSADSDRRIGGNGLFEPDVVLPAQFANRFKGTDPCGPEKLLMLAVLEDAVAVYQKYAFTAGRRARNIFEEAADYIQSEDIDWPFSFVNICNALGLEVSYIRGGVDRWYRRQERENLSSRSTTVRVLDDTIQSSLARKETYSSG